MNIDIFAKCGSNRGAVSYTDTELQDHIDVLSAVIAYFRARDDAGIIVNSLRMELEAFEKFKAARKRNK